jgi:acetyl-CoA carboxylase, biotin carboxylase subunit
LRTLCLVSALEADSHSRAPAMLMFKKILIANRGEIAVRLIRACRELGIISVAVYSDVDRLSLHVQKADEAYHIGPATAMESYLNIQKILDVAHKSGADAIHPGYGFLSENPRFAQACLDSKVKFIGPSPYSMEVMGSKTRAREAMQKAGVPLVPGTWQGVSSTEEASQEAARIGYPVMLKAAAGGGGKGMRLVPTEKDLASALKSAQSEAQRSFGDSEVYLEKAILNPRHIEMQILADEHGNTVFLGERECSIQRRHQKVLEEAPSPIVDEPMRQRMGEVAVQVAKAANYANAGTIEFLVDERKNFYFLEMNTRLQVEHPVTELVTGLDLVHLQIKIAAGEQLPFSQQDTKLRGHAIECRVYAEDPDNQFIPSPGRVTLLREPAGPGIRVDSGIYEGWSVPIEYDPLLAKLVGYGTDRAMATARISRALDEFLVGGIKTNLSLFRRIVSDKTFIAGDLHTGYLDGLLSHTESNDINERERGEREKDGKIAATAAALFAALDRGEASGSDMATERKPSPKSLDGPNRTESSWKRAARAEALR